MHFLSGPLSDVPLLQPETNHYMNLCLCTATNETRPLAHGTHGGAAAFSGELIILPDWLVDVGMG